MELTIPVITGVRHHEQGGAVAQQDHQYSSPVGRHADAKGILKDNPLLQLFIELNVAKNFKEGERVHYAEGTEIEKHFAPTLYIDCYGIEQRGIIYPERERHVILDGPLSLEDVAIKLLLEGGDGAHIGYLRHDGHYLSKDRHTVRYNLEAALENARQLHPGKEFWGRNDILRASLPPNFVHIRDTKLAVDDIGTRMQNAAAVPKFLYNPKMDGHHGGTVFGIRQSAFDHADCGKTFEIDRYGLKREFYLARDDELSPDLLAEVGPHSYFDRNDRIVGVLVEYGPDKSRGKGYIVQREWIDASTIRLIGPTIDSLRSSRQGRAEAR